jgi:indole-3-glycerol phosphate synthase
MSVTILDKILKAKRARVAEARSRRSDASMKLLAKQKRVSRTAGAFRAALSGENGLNIIAEIKRASPSKGIINSSANVGSVAAAYERGGACAISVLTEEDHFQGSLGDLGEARHGSSLPILRKDFIFDEYQVWEAAAYGADAVLLIAAMLDDSSISRLSLEASALGLDALVEVHSFEELNRVCSLGENLIGVNNRNLRSFKVDLGVSRLLIRHAPDNAILVAESGLKRREDLEELRELGYRGFLIGEILMQCGEPVTTVKKLTGTAE